MTTSTTTTTTTTSAITTPPPTPAPTAPPTAAPECSSSEVASAISDIDAVTDDALQAAKQKREDLLRAISEVEDEAGQVNNEDLLCAAYTRYTVMLPQAHEHQQRVQEVVTASFSKCIL